MNKGANFQTGSFLTGQLLLAMPSMRDPRFTRAVIYMCAHSEEGAIGLIINQLINSISFSDLLIQLNIESDPKAFRYSTRIHFGGPVETQRGFVLHSTDYTQKGSLPIDDMVAMTASIDIVRKIANGGGPLNSIVALGYAGWGPGQLDEEIQENTWLNVEADQQLVFKIDVDEKWDSALAKIGIDAASLATEAGRA